MKNSNDITNNNTYELNIKGLVQGVGFRPFIYRVAIQLKLYGTVENRNDGVTIRVNCNETRIEKFIFLIKKNAPPASYIDSITFLRIDFKTYTSFDIIKSNTVSESITDVSPDISVCDDCLEDMTHQKNRINYPFINCTNCGPRFTIIKALPYDRDKTSMKPFIMCESCHEEYVNILDRRFHAQPVACEVCGPEYQLHLNGHIIKGTSRILTTISTLIEKGKSVAIKGLGGFFIACDALNEDAVKQLRNKKNREGKPFAVMFSDLNQINEYAHVNSAEKKSLQSFRRPIVLLNQKRPLAPSVTLGFDSLGAMLPYMPLHYLLFKYLKTPAIVFTSGNLSDEPIIIENNTAIEKLGEITDAVLTYNREIHNRTDDSVVKIINNKERLFRRSRGYVPSPIIVTNNTDGILATGAELVNCFAIGRENKIIVSQHIGDLKNIETHDFYTESLAHFQKLFKFKPHLVVSDMHPDYLSTRYAADLGIKHIMVQHHHAHIAACMAEHNINEKVIGIALDGTGYGSDGHIWGSEFFICDLKTYERINHFEYIPLPGGDKVTNEPWRTAVSYLYKYFGNNFTEMKPDFIKNEKNDTIQLICQAIQNNINCPLSSGAGRLFDAVAALLNVCTHSKFHAEAPMRLEAIIDKNTNGSYPYEIEKQVIFKKMFTGIINDLNQNIAVSVISAKFHNTIVNIILDLSIKIRENSRINKVVLSGGTFQNKYLLEKCEDTLTGNNFEVFSHIKVPTNDAGIALGQVVIGAALSS